MKKTEVQRAAAPKPRNRIALLARQRAAGAHVEAGSKRRDQQKDLVQHLREAGLL